MQRRRYLLAILATAMASTMAHAGGMPKGDIVDCPTTNLPATLSSAHALSCVDHKWVDTATLDHVSIKLESNKGWNVAQAGIVGAPVVMATTTTTGYLVDTTASEAKVGTLETSVTATATVLALNPDHTAHVSVDLAVMQPTAVWTRHIDTKVSMGQKAAIIKDDDGIEYWITVDKLAS